MGDRREGSQGGPSAGSPGSTGSAGAADQIRERVRATFGPNAAGYSTSPSHRSPAALAAMVAAAAPRPTDRLLDVGTGAGHTALAFAPQVERVIALDPTPEMLEETARNAAAAGATNLAVQAGSAEALPFEARRFDLVTARLTTHHFADLAAAVREMARVLRPGGRVVIFDSTVPEDDALDAAINDFERLRDPSHVRNWRPSEWRALVEAAGLTVERIDLGRPDAADGALDFDAWVERIGTPAPVVAELRRRLLDARAGLREALQVVVEGGRIRFTLPRILLVARAGSVA